MWTTSKHMYKIQLWYEFEETISIPLSIVVSIGQVYQKMCFLPWGIVIGQIAQKTILSIIVLWFCSEDLWICLDLNKSMLLFNNRLAFWLHEEGKKELWIQRVWLILHFYTDVDEFQVITEFQVYLLTCALISRSLFQIPVIFPITPESQQKV